MALRLEDKKALVAEVAEVAQRAHSVVAAEYGDFRWRSSPISGRRPAPPAST